MPAVGFSPAVLAGTGRTTSLIRRNTMDRPQRSPGWNCHWAAASAAVAAALLVAGLVAWTTGGGKAGPTPKATVPPHLGWVPADAAFFMSFRVAELWTSADGKILLDGIPNMERGIGEMFERDVGLPPQETETFTFVVQSFDGMFDRRRHEKKVEERFEKGGAAQSPRERFKEKFDKDFDPRPDFKEPRPDLSPAPRAALQPREQDREPLFIVTAVRAAPVAELRAKVVKMGVEQQYKGATYYLTRFAEKFDGKKFEDKGFDDRKCDENELVNQQDRFPGKEKFDNSFRIRSAIYFVDDRTYVIGSPQQIERGIDRGKVTEVAGPLAPALDKAAKKHHLVAGVHIQKKWALEFLRMLGDPGRNYGYVRALAPLGESSSGVLVADLGTESRAALEFHFPDADKAQAATGALQDGLTLLRILVVDHVAVMMGDEEQLQRARDDREEQQFLFTKVLFEELEAPLRKVVVEPKGSVLHATGVVKTSLATIRTRTAALWKQQEGDEKAQENRKRKQSANNLRQIGVAVHNYLNAYGTLPPQAICDRDGKPLLSWRVAILPYLGEDDLYNQLRKDEPWDSSHNLKLLARMPKQFAPVAGKTKEPHTTFYQGFIGPGNPAEATIWENRQAPGGGTTRGIRLLEIRDGTSNTLLVVEAGEPVPWTKPADLPYDPKKPLPKLGGQFADGFHAVFGDGFVRFIPRKTPEATLRALITRSGGEAVPFDFDR
jgi:hypothetical protein